MKKKVCMICCLVLLLLWSAVLPIGAAMSEALPDSYGDLEAYLPEEVLEFLPDGLFSQNPEEAIAAAQAMTRPEYLFRVVLEAVGLRFGEVMSLLGTLLGLLILSALLHRLREAVSGKAGEGVAFILRLSIYALIITRAATMLSWVKLYFERLSHLMTGLAPVMGTLYAMGGNVTGAFVNQEILLLFLNICNYITTSVTPAMCGICLAFSLLDAFGGGLQVRFAPLGGLIKKWYTFLLGFIMFILSLALSTQSMLASGADSMGMKGLRYAIGQMIPVVGGSIASTLGTVAESVRILRGITGVSGIVLVGLMLLPVLIQLLLFRMCYQLSSSVAAMLGCDGEASLLGEIGSLYGYMVAAISICAVVCVLALAIFAHTSAALL